MLDGVSVDGLTDRDVATAMVRDADWKDLHWRLRSIAKRRVALEAEEAGLLLVAEESGLYRCLGYTSMTDYMDRELHYGPHAANERLRVAHQLLELPRIAALFRDGELCFSSVRELTRVATSETEEAFLHKAQGKTAHQVQQMVAGLRPGDKPETQPDPSLITKRLSFQVPAEIHARWRQTRAALETEFGARLSDAEVLDILLRRATEPVTTTDHVPPPPVQIAVTTCRSCKQSFVEGSGEATPIDEPTAARLTCDAEVIGDLETDELTRVKSTIPAAVRRKVFHRDHFACTTPGCRASRFLELHHVIHREDGGGHSMAQITLLCFGCHQRHHEGRLIITGQAPDRLTSTWRRDDDVEAR